MHNYATKLLCAVALLLLLPAMAWAQTGTVRGIVTDSKTGDTLPGANVVVTGPRQGTSTDIDGEYTLELEPGTYELRASFVSYKPLTKEVDIVAGETVTVDFEMQATTSRLEEVVVSGSGTPTEVKRLGSTTVKINAEQAVDAAPITSVNDLISGRAPGVVNLPGSGQQGAGASLRIRGFTSISQSQEPIIYIDGVRVTNGGGFGGFDTGGQDPSRLNDLNPDDIAEIDILRGASAATLYGSEASAGVIVIKTKSGSQGAPRFNFQIEQGATRVPDNFEGNFNYVPADEQLNARTARLFFGFPATVPDDVLSSFWLNENGIDIGFGFPVVPADFGINVEGQPARTNVFGFDGEGDQIINNDPLGDLTETGRRQAYSASVSGGGAALKYFISGKFDRTTGSIGPAEVNFQERVNARANFTATATDELSFQVNTNFVQNETRFPNNDNNIFGYMGNAFLANPIIATPEGDETPGQTFTGEDRFGSFFTSLDDVENLDSRQDVDRFIGSGTMTFSPSNAFSTDLTLGIDLTAEENTQFAAFGALADLNPEGLKTNFRSTESIFTIDNKSTFRYDFSDDFTTSTSFGGQLIFRDLRNVGAFGEIFPGPGLETVSNTATQTASEFRLESVEGGAFLQEQLGFKEHIFLTLGGRADGNTAFGDDFDTRFYPKASVSYVPSDADYWTLEDSFLSSALLRASYGEAGKAPGIFDAQRTFGSASVLEEVPALVPSNLGDDALKPSITREFEAGTDLSFFSERLSTTFTYYNAKTTDDLVPVPGPPSEGFTGTQLRNIGELTSQGFEFDINGILVQREDVTVRFNAFVATNESEIKQLSSENFEVDDIGVGFVNRQREGFSPSSFFGTTLDPENPYEVDTNGNGIPNEEQDFELMEDIQDVRFNTLQREVGSADSLTFLGDPNPDLTGSFSLDITLFKNLRLYGLLDWKTGHQIYNNTSQFRHDFLATGFLHLGQNPEQAQIQQRLYDPETTAAEKEQIVSEELTQITGTADANYIEDADFAKLREISLTYTLPRSLISELGARSVSLRVAARNLATFTSYSGPDPEVNVAGRNSFFIGSDFLTVPQVRSFTTTLKVGF